MLKETKKEFIQVLKDYRKLVNKKHSDIEAYNQIKSKLNLYKQLSDTNRVKWTKEYLDIVERLYKKEAKEIFESLVTE